MADADGVDVRPNTKEKNVATKKAESTAKAPPKAAASKPAGEKKTSAALMKPLETSKELSDVVGKGPMPRTEVVSKIWDYIRKHNLQNPSNKREILADAKLKAVFGKEKATMFEMNKLISGHLK